MESIPYKTRKYVPKLNKEAIKKRYAKDHCFLSENFINSILEELEDTFKDFYYTVFDLPKQLEPEKIQLEGYQKLLEFQRVGCCYSYLLTSMGCKLCKDPTRLEDGSLNEQRFRRCSRFDSSKNRSRSWGLLGIKAKDNHRRFIILWRPNKKYNKRIKEIVLRKQIPQEG